MSTPNKDIEKVEVRLKWDPSPPGAPAHDLDIIAATYLTNVPYGSPAYLVHFDSRSPDGTITLNRDSRTGQGFGFDEVMTLELGRLSTAYTRVVVGVAIQQRDGHKTFAEIANTGVQVREGYTNLAEDDFSAVGAATAATVAEFVRSASGVWEFHATVRGFDGDPDSFAATMGGRTSGA
ncbi:MULTISPECIES: TerD family protein [unclassified Streptomyces]|uniref:TerD family protein n=1 Tax=unclassified Streptomyces TaxID=2593676 RepID=UPI0022585F5B|nr:MULTISPECIES: TerD family protein [unclassified Streptomyces]WSP57945.1 TerD family protein [Streptomyces sp. NBC_01241]WSU21317.1 TerD family protein [Streptomyces sp. NBC_01108]MCX4789867.1 TerD family protein [Streptomyces sp. NBC_01221]MCX4794431.1 TerD family protein [Streptomyces sp. NBC_01242]WSJ35780.1 TerD family protein [Streptomyces sp. NBC_01321]